MELKDSVFGQIACGKPSFTLQMQENACRNILYTYFNIFFGKVPHLKNLNIKKKTYYKKCLEREYDDRIYIFCFHIIILNGLCFENFNGKSMEILKTDSHKWLGTAKMFLVAAPRSSAYFRRKSRGF